MSEEKNWSNRFYNLFLKKLKKVYKNEQHQDVSPFIAQIKTIEQFSLNKKRFFCLFSQIEFNLLYISKNVEEEFGYSREHIYKKGLFLGFKAVYWKQIPSALTLLKSSNHFNKFVGEAIPIAGRATFFCGIKLKDKWGNLRTLFIQQKMLKATQTHPILSYLEVEDITSLYKTDFAWVRFTAESGQQFYSKTFFTHGKKRIYANLLSPREMEILQLIISKKSNVEISEMLHLSKNTIERHRKNMIARVGATDMTALIQIARLANVI